MNLKEVYTKIFLKQAGKSIDEISIQEYLPVWWQNTRAKNEGGLRLTDGGLQFLIEELGLQTYEVPFPKEFELTTKAIIFLDQFIDCPYYITKKGIIVTNEKKAVELHLFSGDIRKYGLVKALKRQQKE